MILSSPALRMLSADRVGTPLGRIWGAGLVEDGPALIRRPHILRNHYTLVFVYDGAGSYVDEINMEQPVRAGDTIIAPARRAHWYGPPPGSCWSEIWVGFSGVIFDALAAGGVLKVAEPVRRVEDPQRWYRRLHDFAERPRGSDPVQRELDLVELTGLLVELRGGQDDPLPHDIHHACDLLASDLAADLDLHDLAADVGLTYETFRKRFRAAVGSSPAAYRLDRRIEAAQTLLRTSTMSIATTAASLGFADERHFARRFRARVGISPGRYREACRETDTAAQLGRT